MNRLIVTFKSFATKLYFHGELISPNQLNAMSLTFKMAPWPEQGNEPKAPDKTCSKGVESNPSDSCKVDSGVQEEHEAKAALGKTDDKQDDKNSGVSDLDDGQLRALLDEAITYKCPKDREGKSNLFRELLEEVEAESDGGEESNPTSFGIIDHNRGGKRRRRDAAVSERQTRGGSLQNIVQAYSDFESVYPGGRSKKSFSGGRKKSDFCHYGLGPGSSGVGACGRAGGIGGSGSGSGGSVSARQREGGSLPCNVNAGGVGGGGVGCGGPVSECSFERVVRRRRSEHQGSWDENVMPAHMDRGGGGPVSVPTPADVAGRSETGSDSVGEVDKSGSAVSADEPCENLVTVVVGEGVSNGVADDVAPRSGESKDSKADGGVEVSTGVELRACCATLLSSPVDDGSGDGVELLDLNVTEDRDGGRKSKGECCGRGVSDASGFGAEPSITASVPPMSSSPVVVSSSTSDRKARREVTRGDSVDTVVPFCLHVDEKKSLPGGNAGSVVLDLTKGLVNGMETPPLQLASSYPSVKSLVGSSTSPVSSTSDSAAASSAATHMGCGESQSMQTGIVDDSNGICGSGKELTIKKQQVGESQTKPVMPMQGTYSMSIPGHHLSVLAYPPNNWITSPESVSRINFHGTKDLNDVKCKSLDENGNAVTMSPGLNKDAHEKGKGKTRRPKTNNDRNTFLSQSIEGFRGNQDLDSLLKFIGMDEDKKSKNTNNGTVERVRRSNLRRESDRNIVSNEVGSGRVRAPRDRNTTSEDKDDVNSYSSSTSGGEKGSSGSKVGRAGVGGRQHQQQQIQRSNKMKKSNSLEEISKTKSEDLTVSSVKKDQENLKSKYIAANSSVVDNDSPKPAKEAAQSITRSSYKQETVDYSAKDEDVSNHNEKLIKGDHNGNSELNSKSDFAVGNKTTMASTSFKEDFYAVTDANPQVLEETEFHVVTKKQRRKKRRTGMGDGAPMERHGVHNSRDCYSYGGNGGNEDHMEEFKRGINHGDGGHHLDADGKDVWESGATGDGRFLGSYRRHHRRHRSQRSSDRLKSTSSVPPSEHSEESSDDSDSVHSLPVSSSVPRPPVDPSSTSSGSTPQASYADIARMASGGPMPVLTGNPGNSPSVILVSTTVSAQKSKVSPVSTESHGQVIVPHVSSSNTFATASLPYIGSAKMNIGAPPVSGSKASSHLASPGDTPVATNNPTPKSESQAPVSDNPENSQESDNSALSTHNPTLPSVQTVAEPRKKDAMTCTALDGKTVSSNYSYTAVPSSQTKSEGDTPAVNVAPNILEDYYPSLQESLHEKNERRNGKSNQHQVQANKVVEDKRSCKNITTPSPSAASVCENKATEVETVVNTNVVSVHNFAEKTSAQSAEKPPAAMAVKTKEPSVTATRIRSSGKKPGFRSLPPVVIMDHHYKQDAASKEGAAVSVLSEGGNASGSCFNSTDIGGFTFGFEVNEELLALSSAENASCEATSLPDDVGKKQNGSLSLAEEELPPPLSTSPGSHHVPTGKDPMPVYRSPEELDTKRFNYEKIVSFIGLSWEDVLKEMSVPVKHSSSRVQYYGGQ